MVAQPSPDVLADVPELVSLPASLWDSWISGYGCGYIHGIERGRDLADIEATELHGRAVGVVRVMSRLDPWDVAERRRRERQQRVAYIREQNARPWPTGSTS